jgi:cell division protein FtsQ
VSRSVARGLFACFVVLVSLFASSWFFFPVSAVSVSGTRFLKPKEVARMSGVLPGNPWLWASAARAGALEANPWVRQARIVKRFPGSVEIKITERTPLAAYTRADGSVIVLAADGVELPGAARPPLMLEGFDALALPEALKVAGLAQQLGAVRLRFTPQGFLMRVGDTQVWSDSYASLLKYGGSVKMLAMNRAGTRVNVYPWGVSVQ